MEFGERGVSEMTSAVRAWRLCVRVSVCVPAMSSVSMRGGG